MKPEHVQIAGGEAKAALRIAAQALCDRCAPIEAMLTVRQGRSHLDVIASWRWPGVLSVLHRQTADLIVQSLPGSPLEPDPAALAARVKTAADPVGLYTLLTEPERRAALDAAAFRLQARERLPRAAVKVLWWGGCEINALAVWRWPGVVRLSQRDTAELIAESLPGRPFDLARFGL